MEPLFAAEESSENHERFSTEKIVDFFFSMMGFAMTTMNCMI